MPQSIAGRFMLELFSGGLPAFIGTPNGEHMDRRSRLARAKFRAWHRGTREADYMVGGFFDAHHEEWGAKELDWFDALLEEDDADIMAWALMAQSVPRRYQGSMMQALQKLDYVKV